MKLFIFVFVCVTIFAWAKASPKKYSEEDGGFQPSKLRYYESNLSENKPNASARAELDSKESVDRYQRFGSIGPGPVSGFGNTGSGIHGYPPPNTGMGYMQPMKIDIGGVALGALLGFGAVLLVPKLTAMFGMMQHGYRSVEGDTSTSFTEILSKIDNSLEQHHIDSSSCMQRVICSYVNEAQKNSKAGEGKTLDQIINTVTNNELFSYMLDGSAVKQAVDMGKQGDLEKCASLYVKCPISRENVVQVIASLLPS